MCPVPLSGFSGTPASCSCRIPHPCSLFRLQQGRDFPWTGLLLLPALSAGALRDPPSPKDMGWVTGKPSGQPEVKCRGSCVTVPGLLTTRNSSLVITSQRTTAHHHPDGLPFVSYLPASGQLSFCPLPIFFGSDPENLNTPPGSS